MKRFIKTAAVGLLILSCSPDSGAQKKGIFNPDQIRPERVETSETQADARPVLSNPVMPIGRRISTPFTDVSEAIPGKTSDGPGRKAAPRALGDGTMIYGSLLYSNTWSGANGPYGIYTFPASSYKIPEMYYNQGSYEANGGGCYGDGTYYWNSFVYTDEMGYTFSTFCKYNFETKEFTKNIQSFINEGFDLQQITNALAYDPTTGRIFALGNIKVVDDEGIFAKYYPSLSEMDPYTGFVTPIAQIPSMVTLACSPAGELYAISKGNGATLYRINKNTGDCTEIGATGINTDFTQSMTFDPVTGKLYWAAVKANGATGLYEVDATTGKASLIFDFENNEEFSGLYIPEPSVEESAPAIALITPIFENGNLTGSVTVTAPSRTYSGAALKGNMTLTFLTDGANAETKTVTPGEKAVFTRTLTEGIHTFTAFCTNDAGDSHRTSAAAYVGTDAPAAVKDLKLETTADGKAYISWKAPETGRNDGYIDPAQLTYNVTRYPDGAVVADGIKVTYFSDPVNASADNYYYVVTPYCGGREGISAATETGIFGTGSALPVRFGFSDKDEFGLFTVIDANGDWDKEYKWGGWMFGADFSFVREEDGDCAVYGYHPENAADDWLITPPVGVEKGKKYRLTFTMWTRGQEERIEVTAGPRNTIEAQNVILPAAGYRHTDHKVFTQDFTASETGNYYIGFHITSAKKQFYAFVTDIIIDAVPDEDAPAAVGGLSAVADPAGENKAVISFTAPSRTVAGAALASLDRIDIHYGNSSDVVKSFIAPRPGAALSWTDEKAVGFMDYRVVPYAAGKAGEKSEARVYVGWDIPLPVENISVDDASGQPVVTWTAPAAGVNGGFMDASKLTYAVYRYEDNLKLLDSSVSGTSFTDTGLDGTKMQHLVAYLVVARGPIGSGEPAASDYIVFGKPYEGEFFESFADATVHSNPWVMYRLKGNTQNWGVTSYGSNPMCYPVGNDGGMAVYTTDGRVGDEGILVSPKLNVGSISAPVLSFYLYHNYTDEHAAWDEGFEDRLIPEVMLPDGTREALSASPIYVDDLGTGWLKYSYPLDRYKNAEYIRLALHGITACEQDIYVDNLSVTNLIANDLQVYSFTGTGRVEAGKTATYKLTVYNRGASDAAAGEYKVNIYDGETLVESRPGMAVASKGYQSYMFDITYDISRQNSICKIHTEIVWDKDEIQSNNVSKTVFTEVTAPSLAEVRQLEATIADKNVSLSWDTPTALRIKDSFEEHVPYETTDFSHYTMVDGDKNYTWGFQDVYFDNSGDRQAFMVFNPVDLGVVFPAGTLFPYDSFDPHTGDQVLACFQGLTVNESGNAVSATNDDWFISPEVFDGQTISLYAKSGDYMQGLDKYELMYSTTDRNVASFRPLSEVVTTGKSWELHEAQLPAGTKYFAIHCVSEDGFVLFIDDLEFMAKMTDCAVKHTGYRLYRDGISLGEFPTGTTSYSDNALADGNYRYYVTALYEDGRESGPSNVVDIRIGEMGLDEAACGRIEITAGKGVIRISAGDDVTVYIVSTDGKRIYSASGDAHSVNVAPGVYIVRAGAASRRVIVR